MGGVVKIADEKPHFQNEKRKRKNYRNDLMMILSNV